MVTWFVFHLAMAVVCLVLTAIVARLDGGGETWNYRGAEHLATMLTAGYLVAGLASIVTGAWSLAVWVTR